MSNLTILGVSVPSVDYNGPDSIWTYTRWPITINITQQPTPSGPLYGSIQEAGAVFYSTSANAGTDPQTFANALSAQAQAYLDTLIGATGPVGATGPTGAGGGGFTNYITGTPSVSQNDWSPSGFPAAQVVFVNPSGNTNLTGFNATGVTAPVKIVINNSATLTVTLKNLTGSAAGNQIFVSGGSDLQLNPGDAAWIYLDPVNSYWRVV